jgi:hypothetical protein
VKFPKGTLVAHRSPNSGVIVGKVVDHEHDKNIVKITSRRKTLYPEGFLLRLTDDQLKKRRPNN